MLAFESGDTEKIQQVIEVGTATPEAAQGLISALGWLPYEQASNADQGPAGADSPAVKADRHCGIGHPPQEPGPALPRRTARMTRS